MIPLLLSLGECDESSARLVGGATDREGRVEVCYEGQWRTVCNDWFDNKFRNSFGRVICRQLGYTDSMIEPFSYTMNLIKL